MRQFYLVYPELMRSAEIRHALRGESGTPIGAGDEERGGGALRDLLERGDHSMASKGVPQVEVALEVEPELGSRAEGFTDREGGIGRHAPLSVDDLVESGVSPFKMASERLLGYAKRLKELLKKHLAGTCGRPVFWKHGCVPQW